MSVVVDSSLLTAALVDSGPEGVWAESILEAGSLAAPELLLVESANILRRLELSGSLAGLEAASAHRDLQQLEITLFPYPPFAERIWDLRSNLTCYDAWYVALAEGLEVELATLDRRLSRASGPTCKFLTF